MSTLTYTNVISFASDIQNISRIEGLINQVFEEHSINPDNFGNVLVALTEAANNAILHGNACNPEKTVSISYVVNGEMLSFTIADQGPGFDPEQLPDPTDPENLEKPNGRGVFLMRRLADKVDFENNGSIVILGFKIS